MSILTQAFGSPTNQAFVLNSITEAIDLFLPQFSHWAVYYTGTSNAAIIPDSVKLFANRGQARVSNYPVEQGAFASFNKVEIPYDIRIILVCQGSNMRRSDFLAQLEVMKKDIRLYDISTPDRLYPSASLVSYDILRDARNGGVSMITADCLFAEIRQTASASYNTSNSQTPIVNSDSPSASDVQNQGNVPPTDPNALQIAVLGNGVS